MQQIHETQPQVRQPHARPAQHDSNAPSSATFPRHVRPAFGRTGSDAFTSPVDHLSPSSPWSNASAGSLAPVAPPNISPIPQPSHDLGFFYNAVGSGTGRPYPMEHSNSSSGSLFGGGVRGQYRPFNVAPSTSPSGPSLAEDASGANDDQERLFYQRDSRSIPRRNHTIASSTGAHRKRLDQHFHQATSSKNSLHAIIGGKEDADDDDWEAMMKRRENLLLADDEEADEELDANAEPWRGWDLRGARGEAAYHASHRRFPSQPASTFGTSPVDPHLPSAGSSGGLSAHQRSESADLIGRLDQGAFASSPIVRESVFDSPSGGSVRRHQSLNHHAGRQMAARISRPRPDDSYGDPAVGASRAYGGMQERPLDAVSSPTLSPIGDDRGLARAASYSDRSRGLRSRTTPQQQEDVYPSSAQLSSSLTDAHAQLMRLSLSRDEGNPQPVQQAQMSPRDASRPKLPSLITNRDSLVRAAASNNSGYGGGAGGAEGATLGGGPVSASAYVPPIGHAHHRRQSSSSSSPQIFKPKNEGFSGYRHHGAGASMGGSYTRNANQYPPLGSNVHPLRGPQTAFPAGAAAWKAEDALLAAGRGYDGEGGNGGNTPTQSNVNSATTPTNHESFQQPAAFSNVEMALPLGPAGHRFNSVNPSAEARSGADPSAFQPDRWSRTANPPFAPFAPATHGALMPLSGNAFFPNKMPVMAAPPIVMHANAVTPDPMLDPGIRALMMAKNYNPPTSAFDTNPAKARFFVIKSFTEDDVQRSLKHEIWASTEKGNQRLDRAFKESAEEGPLYLLFSVNASGHFCGVAQMLTPLDYSSNSTVWVQEGKWKGTFKVRWIYVKDVPNNKLRHIRLTNTTDCKPITQSRDTQELPGDGGRQALKIIAEFPSRTTLLQDWMFYEKQADSQAPQQSAKVHE